MQLAFPPDALAFLDQLRRDNSKAWFEANRARYQAAYLPSGHPRSVALYEPAAVFEPRPGVVVEGRQAIRGALADLLARRPTMDGRLLLPHGEHHQARRGVATGWLVAGTTAVLVLAVPAMAADHDHDDASHAHSHGEETAAHVHGESDEPAAGGEHAHDDAAPIISLDDERLSDDQRAAAQELIDTTTTGMERFNDVATVEAAGYISIGDSLTGFEHFINWDYLKDGRELDADAIESVVFEVTPGGGRELVSAMSTSSPEAAPPASTRAKPSQPSYGTRVYRPPRSWCPDSATKRSTTPSARRATAPSPPT